MKRNPVNANLLHLRMPARPEEQSHPVAKNAPRREFKEITLGRGSHWTRWTRGVTLSN